MANTTEKSICCSCSDLFVKRVGERGSSSRCKALKDRYGRPVVLMNGPVAHKRCPKKGAIECAMRGCPNKSDQGGFFGKYCVPCHEAIKKGGIRYAIKRRREFNDKRGK